MIIADAQSEGETSIRPSWIRRLTLTNVRSYPSLTLEARPGPIVLVGENGAGKTNLLEAISLLAPGQGLRAADFADLSRSGGNRDESRGADLAWAVAGQLETDGGPVGIGTGLKAAKGPRGRSGRIVRIDGVTQSGSGALADLIEMVWLTPQMDGLFTGPASERRRFLDRLVLVFDPSSRGRAGLYERAMRERNRLLTDGVRADVRLAPLEILMAEAGVAIAATRVEVVARLAGQIETGRQRRPDSPFPWASLALAGRLEAALASKPAVEVEDAFVRHLASVRDRDGAAARTLDGPHRSDLLVRHGPKDTPAERCSTGEQKALLTGLVLAHAHLMAERRHGAAPILLLDEIAAHLDQHRRAALFDDIVALGSQCWMTGTERTMFTSLGERALVLTVGGGTVTTA